MEMSTNRLELYCRNRAKATGELTEYDRALLVDVSDRLCSLQAENADKDRLLLEITAKYETAVRIQGMITGLQKLAEADLARVTVEMDGYSDKAKKWGEDLISGYSDAHVTVCAECGFPIPDYGVDKDLRCNWCKAKVVSAFYSPAGPGHCKTSLDRKASTYDKLFHGGHHKKERD